MINIVCSFKGGWILKRLAEPLAAGIPGARLVDQSDKHAIQDESVRLNYYINDWCMSGCRKSRTAKSIAFLDHPKGDCYLRQADAIIAMAPQYDRYARETLRKKTYLAVQPTDTVRYTPKLRLGFVGRFAGQVDYSKRKGKDLIDRVAQLPYVDLRCTLGKLPEEELPEFYRSLDYVLVPALVEGGPMCLTEGLACGVPVIMPVSVGVGELFKDGIIDYECGNFDSLKAVLDGLYEKKLALARLVEKYTWAYWVDQHKAIFREILGGSDTGVYTTCVGDYGARLGKISLPLMEAYAKRHGWDFRVLRDLNGHATPSWVRVELPRRMRENGHARAVYFDLDVIVDPKAPDIFTGLPADGWDLAAWPHDAAHDWKLGGGVAQIQNYCKYAGLEPPQNYDGRNYFNAGVLALRGRFLNWEPGWKESPHECQDQNSLNLAVIRGDLRYTPLDIAWNYGHVSVLPTSIFRAVHAVHCNQPDLAPCQLGDARERLMREAAGSLDAPEPPPQLQRHASLVEVLSELNGRKSNIPSPAPPRKGGVLMATVVAGGTYRDLYKRIGSYHRAYSQKHGYDYRVITEPKRAAWPSPSWWKLDLYHDLDEYDAVVFLDVDAWPWHDAPSIVDAVPRGKFGAFNSLALASMADRNSGAQMSYRDWCGRAGLAWQDHDPLNEGYYCNGGVWVCWREAREVLQCATPVESPLFYEQHQLNWNLYTRPGLYHELGREWNYGHLHLPGATQDCIKRGVWIAHMTGIARDRRIRTFSRCVSQRQILLNQQGERIAWPQ